MKTIIYLRTSTGEQNPENQLKDCLTLTKGEHEILEEKQSAFKDEEREVFEGIRKRIKSGEVEHLIVWDLDRLVRNRKKLIEFFEFCKIYKTKIHSFRQNWLEQLNNIPEPFNEMMHALMLQIMGWLAEEESKKKSERVKAAIRIKENETQSYKGNKWGRKELPKSVVEGVQELFRTGYSIRKIASEVTYWDKSGNKRNISKSSVQKILQKTIGKDYLKQRKLKGTN